MTQQRLTPSPFHLTPTKRRAPDLTPVMDVVFILVVFFLLVSTFSQQIAKPLTVAAPGTAGAVQPADVHILTLKLDGISIDGNEIAPRDLPVALQQLQDQPLKIVVSDDVNYQSLIDLLDMAQTSGITQLVVQPGGTQSQEARP